MAVVKARINEIFTSLQGEGPYAGLRQIFIRFQGCSLNCGYCDTKKVGYDLLSLDDVLKAVTNETKLYHSISLTGGEPLEQAEFLEQLLPLLKRIGRTVYLETNGTLFKELERVIDNVDIISMDIKLPTSTGENGLWDKHRRFLKIAKEKDTHIKIVVTENTALDDIFKVRGLLQDIDPYMPLVVQPVDPMNGIKAPSGGKLAKVKRILNERIRDVSVIPQLHKEWGIK